MDFKKDDTMANERIDGLDWLLKQLDEGHDTLKHLVKQYEHPMSAEASSLCCAEYGARNEERVNSRNGY